MDCVPVQVARGTRSFHPSWLADIARMGKHGSDRYFYGPHVGLVISSTGIAADWALTTGNVQDRWLDQLLLSSQVNRSQSSALGEHLVGEMRTTTSHVIIARICATVNAKWII